jgi:hypothetical protein
VISITPHLSTYVATTGQGRYRGHYTLAGISVKFVLQKGLSIDKTRHSQLAPSMP